MGIGIRETIEKKLKKVLIERYNVDNLSKNYVLLSKNQTDDNHFLLYDIINNKPVGYISFGPYETIGSYTVFGAYSESGFGPFLYESAMTSVYPNGLSMSRDSSTSDDALAVWEKFDARGDVKKERMHSDEITHKKEDLPAGGMYDDEPEKLERIFELEDTRFFYSYGKNVLDSLLGIGKKYMLEHDIDNDDIEEMSWDLE